MDITFRCESCGQSIVIDEAGTGLQVECPKCGQSLTVPQAATESPLKAPVLPSKIVRPRSFALRSIGTAALVLGLAFIVVAVRKWQLRWKPPQPVETRTARSDEANTAQNVALNATTNTVRQPSGGVEDSVWGDGAQHFMSCKVIGVNRGGVFSSGGLVAVATTSIMVQRMPAPPSPMSSSLWRGGLSVVPGATTPQPMNMKPITVRETSEPRLIAVVKHPREKSLAEGDSFDATLRRDGSVEWKDKSGNLRRLPRWVYESDQANH